MKGRSKGSIVLTLLFILIMLGGLFKVFMVMIDDEITGHREISFCREFLRTGGDLMNAVLKKKAFLKPGKITLPKVIFTKGSEELIPMVKVRLLPNVPLRAVHVTLKGESINLRLKKLFLEPPGGSNHPIYTSSAVDGKKEAEIAFPILAEGDYTEYQDFFLPNKKELTKNGLAGFIYVQQAGAVFPRQYRMPVGGTVRGKGVLYNNHDIVIGADTALPDKVWLISSRKIILEENVKMDKGFLYAQDNIYLGHNAKVCGIIVAANGVVKGQNTIYKKNINVLEPFVTPTYYYQEED